MSSEGDAKMRKLYPGIGILGARTSSMGNTEDHSYLVQILRICMFNYGTSVFCLPTLLARPAVIVASSY